MIRLNHKGDTIVEVLIAIAIVGMVLAGAYASANKSLQANRRAQERAEALRVAEQQLEYLKKAGSDDAVNLADGNFCMASATGVRRPMTNGPPPAAYGLDTFTLFPSGHYPLACRVSFNNGGYYYHPWVTGNAETFIVHVRWDGSGGLKQEATLTYRVHQ
jgi:type II secretory pathway pseudopilin PulG